MKTIKEILDEMLDLSHELSAQITENGEIDAVDNLQKAIQESREVFERTKNINGE